METGLHSSATHCLKPTLGGKKHNLSVALNVKWQMSGTYLPTDLIIFCLHFHWRIQGAPPARIPFNGTQFFRFHMFPPKSAHIKGWSPRQLVGAIPMGNPGSTTDFEVLIPFTSLANLGGVPGTRPPYGTQFFHFRIHFHRKVPTSEVHAPPPREILDPPLHLVMGFIYFSLSFNPWSLAIIDL